MEKNLHICCWWRMHKKLKNMKRPINEIIKELNQTQSIHDRLINEIGLLYSKHKLNGDDTLIPTINSKVETFKKIEIQLKVLETELQNAKE